MGVAVKAMLVAMATTALKDSGIDVVVAALTAEALTAEISTGNCGRPQQYRSNMQKQWAVDTAKVAVTEAFDKVGNNGQQQQQQWQKWYSKRAAAGDDNNNILAGVELT